MRQWRRSHLLWFLISSFGLKNCKSSCLLMTMPPGLAYKYLLSYECVTNSPLDRERVHLYCIKTKEVRATGLLVNGLRILLSYYWPKISVENVSSFEVQYWKRGQITNGESGLVSPRNLVHLWSAKFCNFHTTAVRALVWNNGTLLCKIDFNRNLSF